MGIKRATYTGIRLLIALAILYFLFKRIPLPNVISALGSTRLDYLVVASMLTVISQLIPAYRLKLFTSVQRISLTLSQVFEINLVTAFYALFLPGGNLTGGVIRFYKLSINDKKIAEAFASLIMDRITATIALCLVGIVFWLIHFPPDSEYIVMGMAAILFMLIISIPLALSSKRILHVSKIIDLTKVSLIASNLRKFFETIDRFRDFSSRAIVFILCISVMSQIFGVIVYYLLALSLRIEIPFFAMGWIRCAVLLVVMIPISISGLGLREVSLLFLLRPFGVQDDKALALSLVIFGVTTVWIGLIGGLLEMRKFLLESFSSA